MNSQGHFLESCLFFNTNALSRYLLKIGEKAFSPLNISPAHATLMLVVFDEPGISPKKLSILLHLSPSTISRFLNALDKKRLIERKTKGKLAFIYPTVKALSEKPDIANAYKKMVLEYMEILGEKNAVLLSQDVLKANTVLADHLENE